MLEGHFCLFVMESWPSDWDSHTLELHSELTDGAEMGHSHGVSLWITL